MQEFRDQILLLRQEEKPDTWVLASQLNSSLQYECQGCQGLSEFRTFLLPDICTHIFLALDKPPLPYLTQKQSLCRFILITWIGCKCNLSLQVIQSYRHELFRGCGSIYCTIITDSQAYLETELIRLLNNAVDNPTAQYSLQLLPEGFNIIRQMKVIKLNSLVTARQPLNVQVMKPPMIQQKASKLQLKRRNPEAEKQALLMSQELQNKIQQENKKQSGKKPVIIDISNISLDDEASMIQNFVMSLPGQQRTQSKDFKAFDQNIANPTFLTQQARKSVSQKFQSPNQPRPPVKRAVRNTLQQNANSPNLNAQASPQKPTGIPNPFAKQTAPPQEQQQVQPKPTLTQEIRVIDSALDNFDQQNRWTIVPDKSNPYYNQIEISRKSVHTLQNSLKKLKTNAVMKENIDKLCENAKQLIISLIESKKDNISQIKKLKDSIVKSAKDYFDYEAKKSGINAASFITMQKQLEQRIGQKAMIIVQNTLDCNKTEDSVTVVIKSFVDWVEYLDRLKV